ncbi:hypothetical protein LCO01nite_16310 [Lapidilactobacillus concavus]|uniref:helix-turn-helix domain-containing protein n=1 Tax=Lapidilactobacillus concavus TaxID=287844 RepID=UPI000708F065|nr:helix-turn-helix transcriptional regulator [Lapidilactobacillus concavus]GEL14082.1 hypothetical protein LCO01nite_16310 [Lapidilactobacillus concavus]
MKISTVIYQHLKQKNMTMYRLAKTSGLTYVAVYQLMQGQKDAKISTLIKIADVLDFSLDEFRREVK